MNGVHLVTQEKKKRVKTDRKWAECTAQGQPRPRAQRLGRAPAAPLLRTPRALAARAPCRAPAPVRAPTHARPSYCRAPARSSAPPAHARAAQRPCRLRALRATPARPKHARLPRAPCTPSTHAPRAQPAPSQLTANHNTIYAVAMSKFSAQIFFYSFFIINDFSFSFISRNWKNL